MSWTTHVISTCNDISKMSCVLLSLLDNIRLSKCQWPQQSNHALTSSNATCDDIIKMSSVLLSLLDHSKSIIERHVRTLAQKHTGIRSGILPHILSDILISHSIWHFDLILYLTLCLAFFLTFFLAIEVRRGPQYSESRRVRSGEAHRQRSDSRRLRSGEAHCDRELAVEVRRGPLRSMAEEVRRGPLQSRAGRWGPARKRRRKEGRGGHKI